MESEHQPKLPLYKQKLDIAQPDAAQMLDSLTLTAWDNSYGFRYHISWVPFFFILQVLLSVWICILLACFVFSVIVVFDLGRVWLIDSCLYFGYMLHVEANYSNILYIKLFPVFILLGQIHWPSPQWFYNKCCIVLSFLCLQVWMKG